MTGAPFAIQTYLRPQRHGTQLPNSYVVVVVVVVDVVVVGGGGGGGGVEAFAWRD
jgi:hypothetical protein